jgi:hypothetical protein
MDWIHVTGDADHLAGGDRHRNFGFHEMYAIILVAEEQLSSEEGQEVKEPTLVPVGGGECNVPRTLKV